MYVYAHREVQLSVDLQRIEAREVSARTYFNDVEPLSLAKFYYLFTAVLLLHRT